MLSKFLMLTGALLSSIVTPIDNSSNSLNEESGVEDVIVEQYASFKQKGEKIKTYRIFVDLKEGYNLQAVFGNKAHPITISSTDLILNEEVRGVTTGNRLNARKLEINDLYLDSFLTINTVSNSFAGVLKKEDTDGSIYSKRQVKDKSLAKKDGYVESTTQPLQSMGIESDVFGKESIGKELYIDNGAWAIAGGVSGPTESNKILIAQITTKGEISYELNLQVSDPFGAVEQYVSSNAKGSEILCKHLKNN